MIATIEISRLAKVPMLYLGNPGVGKTTIVDIYAEYCYGKYKKKTDYHMESVKVTDLKMHVESVIGSGFDRSEILGYMVNDPERSKDFLTMKDPEWYRRILEFEEKGIPSFLFIDEIPTTPKDVQGSLYRLIFERELNSGHKLPDDCIIISAGNYKANLPVMCDITAPSINRFCIINFQPRSFKELIEESSQDPEDLIKDLPEFKSVEMTPEFLHDAKELSKNILLTIDDTYNGGDTSKGEMDCNCTSLADIFDADYSDGKAVYNFISKRTIGYFHKCFAAMLALGITDRDIVGQVVDGLIGLGFNSFSEIKELNAYRKFVKSTTVEALKNFKKGKTTKEEFVSKEETITGKVEELSLLRDELSARDTANLISNIVFEIIKTYPTTKDCFSKAIFDGINGEKVSRMKSDISSIEKFIQILNELPNSEDRNRSVDICSRIVETYKFYQLTSN